VDVQVGGTRYRVDVRRDGDAWIVSLDGRTCRVDARRVAGGWSLLIGPGAAEPSGARRSHDVAFDAGHHGLRVHVDGVPVPVSFPGAQRRSRRQGAGAATGTGQQIIAAPMPGRVVKVLVAAGDVVTDRQLVAVLEAMKMQNDVRVARAGRVAEVRAIEGALVEAGAVLVVIDPETQGESQTKSES
jgi:biotin carboxyl carrier protein